jgi:hypothetical protein
VDAFRRLFRKNPCPACPERSEWELVEGCENLRNLRTNFLNAFALGMPGFRLDFG